MSIEAGKILGRGASKCTISETICGDSPEEVTSVLYRTDPKSLNDFRQETDRKLLRALADIDPNGERFLFAQTLSNVCNPKLRVRDLPLETQIDLERCLPSVLPDQLVKSINFFQVTKASKTFSDTDIVPERYILGFRTSVQILHDNGIVHGDLHRRNLGLRKDFPVIFDFGMAKFESDLTRDEWSYAVKKDWSMLERALQQPKISEEKPLSFKEKIAAFNALKRVPRP